MTDTAIFRQEVRRMTVEVMDWYPGCSEQAAMGYASQLVAMARALMYRLDYATRQPRSK